MAAETTNSIDTDADVPTRSGTPASVYRVLVVDDDPDINRLVQVRLRTRGFSVVSARNGREALAIIQSHAPDLLFLDVSMPEVDGLEVLKWVRSHGHDMAVIMMTAFGSEKVAAEALRHGADDYLRKPFEPDEFRAVLTRTVERLELKRQNALLYRFAVALQGAQSIDDAYAVISSQMIQILPEYAGVVFLTREAGDLLEAGTKWGAMPDLSAQPFAAQQCIGLQNGAPYAMPDTSGLICDHLPATDPVPSLCIPLLMPGESPGLLHLRCDPSLGAPERGSDDQSRRQLAATVAVHIALNLGNLRLREVLRSQSIRDSLTGLFNRRYVEESMIRELARADRDGYPVGVIMLDIDHFKRFNDTLGHDAGDAVLRAVGEAMRNGIRTGDIACRYGGEEFIAILPGAGLDATRARAEQLRGRIRTLRVEHRGSNLGPITASFGIAIHTDCDEDCDALIHAADSALYKSKQAGRDRVTVAT